jgi:hypothetical protein
MKVTDDHHEFYIVAEEEKMGWVGSGSLQTQTSVGATSQPSFTRGGAPASTESAVTTAIAAPALTAVQRKERPLCTGVLDYFPDALMEVAHCSWVGNNQHNPGQPLHWAKEKSTDEPDALLRHLKDRGTLDSDGVRHSAKVAWRSLALLQREIEAERG